MNIDGLYEIIDMELWDNPVAGLPIPVHISIQGKKGKVHFTGFDGRMELKKSGDRYLFTWAGHYEGDRPCGYGNFTSVDGTLHGRLYMYDCYETSFVARKTTLVKKRARRINRELLVVTARQPFKEWAEAQSGWNGHAMGDVTVYRSVYLILPQETAQQRDLLLAVLYEEIFTEQLYSRSRNDATWPLNRTVALFKRWFDVEFHPVITDLSDDDTADIGGCE